jgi:hypothetical protein
MRAASAWTTLAFDYLKRTVLLFSFSSLAPGLAWSLLLWGFSSLATL